MAREVSQPFQQIGAEQFKMFDCRDGGAAETKETRDVREPLSKFYTEATTYADFVNDKYNFGTYKVREAQTDRRNEPENIGGIEFTEDGAIATTRITKPHAKDHFRNEVGFNPFPLHKQVRTAVELAEAIVNQGLDTPKRVRLSSFEGVRCSGAIVADTTMETKATIVDKSDTQITVHVGISRNGKTVTTMETLTCAIENVPLLAEEAGEKTLLEDQLIESAAQMSGMLSWDDSQEGASPLFLSIGPSKFYARAKAGDIVTGLIDARPTRKGSDSDVVMMVSGKELAEITKINSIVAKTNVVKRILGI